VGEEVTSKDQENDLYRSTERIDIMMYITYNLLVREFGAR
jgi:hypothetical protein